MTVEDVIQRQLETVVVEQVRFTTFFNTDLQVFIRGSRGALSI